MCEFSSERNDKRKKKMWEEGRKMDKWRTLMFGLETFLLDDFFFLSWQYSQVFYGNDPLLPWRQASGWTLVATECDSAGEALYSNKGKQIYTALHLDCCPPCLKRQEDEQDTKEKKKARQKMISRTVLKGGLPRLFLTSSLFSRRRTTVFHSCFCWLKAGMRVVHNMYHEPSLLVSATVLFCTFAVPLSFSPKIQHLPSTYTFLFFTGH